MQFATHYHFPSKQQKVQQLKIEYDKILCLNAYHLEANNDKVDTQYKKVIYYVK